MQDSEWERFTQTGQVCDYLSYKGHQIMEKDLQLFENHGGFQKNKYAGICSVNRDSDKIRTNR